MKKLFVILLSLVCLATFGQSETHNFVNVDTVLTGVYGVWGISISHPNDTISRPGIVTFPGMGEMGVASIANAKKYGVIYWLNNGWDGSVVLGNGTHYPILAGVNYYTNNAPAANAVYEVLSFIQKTYHIKPGSLHIAGLSNGAGAVTLMPGYEVSVGDQAGMKLVKSATALSGFADVNKDSLMWKIWATKYGGQYTGTEGYADVMRMTFRGANWVNSVHPGNAYFSYNSVASGTHGGWNSLYDPKMTDWRTDPVGKGTYYSPSQGPPYGAGGVDIMGNHKPGESLFQWMVRQGDTTLVTAVKPNLPPVANAGPAQTITLPTNSVTLDCSGSYDPDGIIASCSWDVFGPSGIFPVNGDALSGLTTGLYHITLTVTDNQGATSTATTTVTVLPAPKVVLFSIKLIDGKTFSLFADGSYSLQ